MNRPPEIAAILAEILTRGISRLRGEPIEFRQVTVEADQIHNLPDPLVEYTPRKLLDYRDVERHCYLRDVDPGWHAAGMADAWGRLEWFVQDARDRMGEPGEPNDPA